MPVQHLKKGVQKVKHHVLPHPQHKTRATLLKNRAIFAYSLAILCMFVLFKGVTRVAPGVLSYASNIKVEDLLKYTNAKRSAIGVNELAINPKLSEAAHKKAEHMFKNNYWAHVAPDGTDPWSFIISEDYDYIYAGENLAKNFNSSKDVIEAWYKSPSHKENLLSEKYNEVGFAAVNGVLDGYETTLVVQMFGKLRKAPAQVAVKGPENNTSSRPEVSEAIKVTEPAAVREVTQGQSTSKPAYEMDVYKITRTVTVFFATLMFTLFALDMWYSKKHAILKCTGHSFAHMAFLLFAITVIYFSLQPGRLI